MQERTITTGREAIFLAGIFGFLSVALGAFGAHGLKDHLSSQMMAIYHTGVEYQMTHTLALFTVGLLQRMDQRANRLLIWSGRLFAIGIVFFSGSLYILAVSGVKLLGAITPLGGVAFLAGWSLLAIWGYSERR